MDGRNVKGQFAKGNTFASGRPKGSLGSLNKEMLKRVQEQGDKGRFVDTLLFDIAYDTDLDIAVRLKAGCKLADLLYSKASFVEDDKKETLTGKEIETLLMEKLAAYSNGVN